MKAFLTGFRFAFEGILFAFRTQRNLRVHLTVAIVVLLLAAWLQLAPIEWSLLLIVMGLVIVLEIVNTAIEQTVDRIGRERHPLAKAAKDAAAGAVLVAAILAVAVGLLLLGPPLWERLFGELGP